MEPPISHHIEESIPEVDITPMEIEYLFEDIILPSTLRNEH